MIRSAFAVLAASVAAAVDFRSPASARKRPTRDGTVHFETSCTDIAQRRFSHALPAFVLVSRVKQIFEEVLKADAKCNAYWGIALSLLNNPHAPPLAGNLPLGLAAIEKGGGRRQDPARGISSMPWRFSPTSSRVDHRSRVLGYLKAMEGGAGLSQR
jgi:hypothetical protein